MRRIHALAAGLTLIMASFTGTTSALALTARPSDFDAAPLASCETVTSTQSLASMTGTAGNTILPAANPLDLSESQIYDPMDVLKDGIYQVKSSVESLKTHGLKLYVAVLDDYSGLTPDEWNTRTAELTSNEPDTYYLSLNMADKQFSATATSGSKLNSAQIDELAKNAAAPQFSTGEFASGISSFAQQLLMRSTATPTNPAETATREAVQSSTNRWLIVVLLASMVVAVFLAVALYRRASTAPHKRTKVDFDSVEQADRDEEHEAVDKCPPTANAPIEGAVANQRLMKVTPPAAVATDRDMSTNVDSDAGISDSQEEVNYTMVLNQISELAVLSWGAQEDLRIVELLLGASVAAPFADSLGATQNRAAALLAELAGTDGAISTPRSQEITEEIAKLRQDITLEVSQYAKQCHPVGAIKSDLNRLASLWNQIRKEIVGAQSAQQILNESYLSAPISHSRANLSQATKLLKASYKGILSGQESIKQGDEQTASRYARGAQRAIVQAKLAADNILKLQDYLGWVSDELSTLKVNLSLDVDSIRSQDSNASGPEIAMAERALNNANAALMGKADSIEALVKLRSAQASLYYAYAQQAEIESKLRELPADFDSSLQHTKQLRSLLETDLRLRRKNLEPRMLVDLARCDQLLAQIQLKQHQDSTIAMSMLNTCTEMLVQVQNDLPAGFQAKIG
ncbi:TPM domain-containing protein [Mobiluncus mulieris]|uniref:TPM domain-containing protein n=2 Tax=Mobiluncus mulieris TaxID=2052 RepID=UPI0021E24ECD|nr:hypothetical protein [Mobiluncus mulieris]